jgi:NAD(P)-dependent dehydrogenase (short-subunit alcohol dehydrogenase family)
MKLNDKAAIATSGARGSGEAILRADVPERAHVVIGDVETEEARALAGFWRKSAKPEIPAERP